MSGETAARDADARPDALARRVGRPTLPVAAGAAALVPAAAATLLAALRNAPVVLPAPVRAAAPAVDTLAAVVPALALVALGAASDRLAARIGLVAAGVFAGLGAAGDTAWYPAAAALVVGAGYLAARAVRTRSPQTAILAALAFGATSLSLLGSSGLVPVGLRSLGATAAFGALAALPVLRSLDTAGLAGWVLAAVAVGWWTAGAPFVTGAVTLVAFGTGDVPFVLLALGVGGALAVALAGLRRRRWPDAVGAGLLLAAGAPATLARATAVVLAVAVFASRGDADA